VSEGKGKNSDLKKTEVAGFEKGDQFRSRANEKKRLGRIVVSRALDGV